MRFLAFTGLLALIAYMKWHARAPKDPVGTYLEDSDHTARMLIRAGQKQRDEELDRYGDIGI